MKTIFSVKIYNPYQSHVPRGFYDKNGHKGVDLKFVNESFYSPITGKVVRYGFGREMGNTLYIEDSKGSIHVFGHLSQSYVKVGQTVGRNQLIAKTGNTGSRTTNPHMHFEIITKLPQNENDKRMDRALYQFRGFNTDPMLYVKKLYDQFNLDYLTGNPRV